MRIPYVVGQWVRGERFYGRGHQIDEILEGHRNAIWLLGTRRVGKTSLLKRLEQLTATHPEFGYFPVFWDFQGAEDQAELHLNFADALLDAEERLGEIGVRLSEVEADDLFVSLGRLRRRLRAEGLKVLLLCDEVEELIKLRRAEPSLLRKLRRVMQSHDDTRSVLASTIRLWALAELGEDTSPFLHGFTPPLYIERLTNEDARALIEQTQLPRGDRPPIAADAVEKIRSCCDNHPYLLQLVCKRRLETGDLKLAIDQVATDPMVSHFFAVDLEMLSAVDREVILAVARRGSANESSILSAAERLTERGTESIEGSMLRLQNLGFVRRDSAGRFELANWFFRRWLREMTELLPIAAPPATGEITVAKGAPLGVVDERYELLSEVGAGGAGIVYRCHDRLLDTVIAIKLLRAEHAGDAQVVDRFRQEIILARDLGHPNILRMYHLGQHAGTIYLTMQWVDGPTLEEVIDREAPLPEAAALSIGAKIASALAAAHSRQILHRDIKPQNVLVDAAGEPLVTDFGLARLLGGPSITQSGMFLGTPNYASPEQAEMRPLDERSDLYALGLLLYEMVTGRLPFEAESARETLDARLRTAAPDPREFVAELRPDVAATILRCLASDPADRYGSAADLHRTLERLGRLSSDPGASD